MNFQSAGILSTYWWTLEYMLSVQHNTTDWTDIGYRSTISELFWTQYSPTLIINSLMKFNITFPHPLWDSIACNIWQTAWKRWSLLQHILMRKWLSNWFQMLEIVWLDSSWSGRVDFIDCKMLSTCVSKCWGQWWRYNVQVLGRSQIMSETHLKLIDQFNVSPPLSC